MRIAQLTLDGYENYGQVLQRYALQRVLKNFTESVEVLWHQRGKYFPPQVLELNRYSLGNKRDAAFNSVRRNKIKEFNDANICTRFDVPYLEDLADEYDFFVVGSDQVWNPKKYFKGRFLEFAPRRKRIAYAASIAVSELPDDVKDYYREKISEMPYVSLREKEGVDFVEKLTGKKPLLVVDPVFLLTTEDWRKLSKRPAWLNKKIYDNGYIMTYFFNGTPPRSIEIFANELNLPLINMYNINNFDHYITGIEEFLYLIDHATLIDTQSFHGTAFATIFERPFISRGNNSRVKTLLELFNLNERVLDTKLKINDDVLKIDFTRRDEVLPFERAKAFKFLSEALLSGGDAK